MKRKTYIVLAMTFVCLLNAQGLYPWGSLTHVYITSQILPENGSTRDNAIYGSTAPDFGNYMFGSPFQGYLENRIHADFIRVWNVARGGPAHKLERAAAFGFVAHNYEDYTAHTMSQSLDPHSGYVVQKGEELNNVLAFFGVWQQFGIEGPQFAALRGELSHNLIEFAGDYLIALYTGSQTGQLLSNAAAGRSGEFPTLLTKSFGGNLVAFSNHIGIRLNQPAASSVLTGAEAMFQGSMAAYGGLFANDDPVDLLNDLAVFLKQMALALGIQIGDPAPLILVLAISIDLIQPDFSLEVSKTISFAARRLKMEKVAF